MDCSSCGAENRVGRRFCAECGTSLVAPCPSCGALNEPGEKFCGDCGGPLTSDPLAASRLPGGASSREDVSAPSLGMAPVAERRVVSVLFADLVGFTTFAEERDAEEVRETLTRYFDLASEVVRRYGGTVEKFIGDAVMAVWGTPIAHEDDAERAVRAGLELVDAVRALGPGIEARAGIMTGEAAVTLGASNQGMVAGDLVNTASRLQGVAPAGSVLVGEAAQRAASRAIAFEAAGGQVLKGKAAPVPAWRALRVVAERGGRNRSETLEAPFIGRHDELRLLKDLFHATAREGRARLVSVTGPAGIGKSRLAWEFLKYVDGLAEAVYWHDGRSPAYGDGVTFWALGEMIRGRCGLLETDDDPTTRAKVAATLERHVPDPEERRWIEPALHALLGIGSGVGSEQLFGAWRTFFERLAATAPVILVFEDFHFADGGLLDFVDQLLDWSRSAPIYVLTLARPELLERRADWGAAKRSFTSLHLEPLSEPAMLELLAGLVPNLPDGTVRAIIARADGVPLYAVETIRMLISDGKLEQREGTYVPVGDLAALDIPETLTALIASRLDGLGPAERSLVSDAAVLGQSFTRAGLAAVAGVAEPELEPHLRSLVRREILALAADPRSPERGRYAFVQSLIREVAYHTLAKPDRKIRHLAAARYLEALGSDELAGALAGHYIAARENAPEGPERDALAAQARIALRGAGERAAALASHDQARGFLEQALTITSEPADRAELLERAGEEASTAGRHDAAERHLRAAVAVRRDLRDRPAIARATAALVRALVQNFQVRDALAIVEPASAEFADLADEPSVVALGSQLARTWMLVEENRRSVEASDRVLEAAERADLRAIVADALITKGTALANLHRMIEGLALVRAGINLAEALDLGETMIRGSHNLAGYERELDPRSALTGAREALALARRLGRRGDTTALIAQLTGVAFDTGDWPAALREVEAALDDELEGTDRFNLLLELAWFQAHRGEPIDDLVAEATQLMGSSTDLRARYLLEAATAAGALAAGRLDEARASLHHLTEISQSGAHFAWAAAARLALWSGDRAEAERDLASIEASGAHGPLVDAGRMTIRAGIFSLDERTADALAVYRDALRAWQDLGLAWYEALCGIDMATLLDPAEPEVRAAVERSREILVRLEAKPFIERLDAAAARGPAARSGV